MANYKVISRQFRPQCFGDVRGQDAIVATLKNALRNERLAHAYLFCGSRGTGKTTLARILAKALNCEQRSAEQEPCNACSSCKEISSGSSLSVIEIDGASNRGIEDIRQINDTVGYASSSRYQIYIIDEVHMLTKEAFNALLKTLEEPPPNVKFFFATTEPHKVLPTIISRCQRFNLNRIAREQIIAKLTGIASDLGVEVEDRALQLLATLADGGMRDAESLFDQMISFSEGAVTEAAVASVLGMMPREVYFRLDKQGKEGKIEVAFEIAQQIFAEGKDLQHFVEGLLEHFRNIAAVQVSGVNAAFLSIPESEKPHYAESAKIYQRDQLLSLLDELIEAQQQMRMTPTKRIALEAILMRIVRSHHRVGVDQMLRKLAELESRLGSVPVHKTQASSPQSAPAPAAPPATPPAAPMQPVATQAVPARAPAPAQAQEPAPMPTQTQASAPVQAAPSLSVDPNPAPEDIPPPRKAKKAEPKTAAATSKPKATAPKAPPPAPVEASEQARRDTVMQFAAVELNGTLQKESS